MQPTHCVSVKIWPIVKQNVAKLNLQSSTTESCSIKQGGRLEKAGHT